MTALSPLSEGVMLMLLLPEKLLNANYMSSMASSASAVEYTDCISAEG